jgi:anti-anti-sigma factor
MLAHLTVLRGGRCVEVHVLGPLDGAGAATLRASLRSALQDVSRHGRSCVCVDLTEVAFLDSAGLAVLLGLRQRLPEATALTLMNVDRRILIDLHAALVDRLFTIQPMQTDLP